MPDTVNRPWEIKVSIACASVLLLMPIFYISIIFSDYYPLFLTIPFEVLAAYMLVGIYRGDSFVRWLAIAVCTCLMALALYLLHLYVITVPAYTDVEPIGSDQNAHLQKEGLWKVVLLLLSSAPAILLQLPGARRWFNERRHIRVGLVDGRIE